MPIHPWLIQTWVPGPRHLSAGRNGATLVGPAGKVRLDATVDLVWRDPLLVANEEVLLAVDERRVLGPGS